MVFTNNGFDKVKSETNRVIMLTAWTANSACWCHLKVVAKKWILYRNPNKHLNHCVCVCVCLYYLCHTPEMQFCLQRVIKVTRMLHQSILAETLMNMQPRTWMPFISEKLNTSRTRPHPTPRILELHFRSCKGKQSTSEQKVHSSACPSERLIICCALNKVRKGIFNRCGSCLFYCWK